VHTYIPNPHTYIALATEHAPEQERGGRGVGPQVELMCVFAEQHPAAAANPGTDLVYFSQPGR